MGCLQQIYTRSGLFQGIVPLVHFMDGARYLLVRVLFFYGTNHPVNHDIIANE